MPTALEQLAAFVKQKSTPPQNYTPMDQEQAAANTQGLEEDKIRSVNPYTPPPAKQPGGDTSLPGWQVAPNPTESAVPKQLDPNQAMAQAYAQKDKLLAPYLAQQEAGLKGNEDTLSQLRDSKPELDLTHLFGLTDSLFGTDTQKNYKAPKSNEERLKQVSDLENLIQKQRGDLTSEKAKELSDKLSGSIYGQQYKRDNMQLREDLTTQKMFDANQKINKQRLDGAARIGDIFRDVDKGLISGNVATKSLVLSEIQRLETGVGNSAYEGQVKKEMGSKIEEMKELIQRWTGKPRDTVPPEILTQLRNIAASLAGSYMDGAQSETDIMAARARPTQLATITKSHNALMTTYKDRLKPLLSSQGTVEKPSAQSSAQNLVERQTKDGKTALFDADTKQFVRYK